MRKRHTFGVCLFTVLAALVSSATPARAGSFTIDSTNCNSSGGCFGLAWTLTVNSGSFLYNGDTFDYQVMLDVTDDPLVSGTPTTTISAVDFKISNSPSDPVLYAFPSSSSGWTTSVSGLSSGGCNDNSKPGFVCSQTASDPANFIASSTKQTWSWYLNSADAIFTNLNGAHIGAKLVDLSRPGHLLSASYAVPEPSSLGLLFAGLALVGITGLRSRRLVSLR